MSKITKKYAEQLLATSQGRFFSVDVTNTEGYNQTVVARVGVTGDSYGGYTPAKAYSRGFLRVYDVALRGVRNIRLNHITQVVTNGRTRRVA